MPEILSNYRVAVTSVKKVSGQIKGPLSGNSVDEKNIGLRIDLFHPGGKNFPLGLRHNISLGNDDDIRIAEHRTDLPRRMKAGQTVNHTYSRKLFDMRRATVAQAGTFRNQIS